MFEFPHRLHRRDKLDERCRVLERVLASVTDTHERTELALEHLRHQLERVPWRGRSVEENFFIAHGDELARERCHGRIRLNLRVAVQEGPFAQEGRLNRARCRAQNIADDLGELFLRMTDVHQLIEAEQRRGPRLFFEKVSDPRRTPTDAMLVFIARRPDAAGIRGPRPSLRRVRPDMLESVKDMFDTRGRRERARSDVANPSVISWPYVKDDHLIIEGTLIYQKLGEGNTLQIHSNGAIANRINASNYWCRVNVIGAHALHFIRGCLIKKPVTPSHH